MAGGHAVIFIPAPPILSAIVASVSLPLFLFLLAHSPWRPQSPMRHFLSAAGLSCALMAALLTMNGLGEWPDLFAAFVVLVASLLAEYTLWTLIVWGFTLAMLNVLERHRRVASIEAWCVAQSGAKGIDFFTLNRCGLLLAAGFAQMEPSQTLTITRRGRPMAVFVGAVRWMFGLGRP